MRRRDRLGVFAILGAIIGAAGLAAAADIGVVPKKLIVVDKGASGAKLVYVSKDRTAGITKGMGTDVGQISVAFDVAYANGSAAGAFTLPAGASDGTAGWVVNKATVAKYVNKAAPSGPTQAKVAVIKPGKLLKLVGKGLGDVPLDVFGGGDPGTGGVKTAYCVTNGAEEHCHLSDFTGCVWKLIAGGAGAKLVCKTGAAGCYTDTGLTVIDGCTNLEWEKKDTAVGSGVDAGNLHDVDNRYTWAGRCTLNTSVLCQPNAAAAATCAAQTGGAFGCGECGVGEGTCNPVPLGGITTIWDWVNQVNAASFAGHSDWRLATSAGLVLDPSGEPAELESIVDLSQGRCGGGSGACIDPIFGPTVAWLYWSASTRATGQTFAWVVDFDDSSVGGGSKASGRWWVRAVRPGS